MCNGETGTTHVAIVPGELTFARQTCRRFGEGIRPVEDDEYDHEHVDGNREYGLETVTPAPAGAAGGW